MFYSYILRSVKTSRHYYGSCKNLKKRLKEHNSGKVKYTRSFTPWEIIYYDEFETRSEAYRREMFFKSIDGYLWLKEQKIIS